MNSINGELKALTNHDATSLSDLRLLVANYSTAYRVPINWLKR